MSTAPDAPDLVALVHGAATAQGIDPALLTAVAWVETAFEPRAGLPSGVCGPIPLAPATARELGVTDPRDPAQCLAAAARHLARQLEAFPDLETALAAFIAGPAAVERHGGVPPYSWSRTYVARVMACYGGLRDPGAPCAPAPPPPPSSAEAAPPAAPAPPAPAR